MLCDKDAASHEELLCEQAFLLMKCVGQDNMNPVLGLMKMEEYMKDPDMRKILAEKYQLLRSLSIKKIRSISFILMSYIGRCRNWREE